MTESRRFHVARERGNAVAVGERVVTPVALVVRVDGIWRGGFAGGFAWVRPLVVEVRAGGNSRTLPILDLNLLAGTLVGVATAVVTLLVKRASGRSR